MQRILLVIISALSLAATMNAQTASDHNSGLRVTYDSLNDDFSLFWWARSPRTYFIKQSDDLLIWNYVPVIEPGNDAIIEWGFTTAADKSFFRLRYTETRTLDPWNDDFDGDGIGNYLEVLLGTDPFVDEGAVNTSADDDNDLVVNGEDAAPADDTVGRLSVTISYPADSSTLN